MADIPASEQYRIAFWTGEFADPATEALFRDRTMKKTAGELRVALVLWALLLILFSFNDYTMLGLTGNFYEALATRIIVAVSLLTFTALLGSRPRLAVDGRVLTVIVIVAFTFFFRLYFLLPRETTPWMITVTAVILIALFVFLPNRVIYSCCTAAYGVGGTLFSVSRITAAPAIQIAGLFIALLFPVIIGIIVAYRFQTARRREFAALAQAEAVNTDLRWEIARREQLEKRLLHQAHTDPLTGLYNRRFYEQAFENEFKRARRHGLPLALAVLDLDHFKSVNDTHGHAAGDVALRQTARHCRNVLRETDIIGRLGGEEFVILMPHTSAAAALFVADRLREGLAGMDIEAGPGRFRLTACIGITELRPEDTGIADLIRRADQALYQGKATGRNRVCTM